MKELIRAYGATYYDAPREADELCALLVIKKKVWACMSEDMDMFVYGCNRVIKYLSLLNHTVVLYDLNEILNKLGITQSQLREICVLSGTDYNLYANDKNAPTLYNTLKLFKKYKKSNIGDEVCFYEWLLENTKYIQDYQQLKNINMMFDLSLSHENLKIFENIKIMNGSISNNEIQKILKEDGFFFAE